MGDGTLGGLGWIGRFISEECAASAEGDEDEISTGIGNSAPGGLACWTTGTFTSCSSIISSANVK
jgi:hypothetical protein